MDIQAKVAARRAELERTAKTRQAEAEAAAKAAQQAAKREASRRLAEFEVRQAPLASAEHNSTPASRSDDGVDEQLVEKELDKQLDRKANDMWSTTENVIAVFLILGGIATMFIYGFWLGLAMVLAGGFYCNMLDKKYKRIIKASMLGVSASS